MSLAKVKRVACYIRVSTSEQSTEIQRREIEEYCSARGFAKVVFFEDKTSGTHSNREEFKKMMALLRSRKFDLLICWKLDRLFRSLKDLISTLQELTELCIEFICLNDQIDLTTSSGRLMMHLIGAFAEFEASLIRDRVRAGMANAKAKGKILGRPKIRNDQAILKLKASGISIRQIARHFKISKGSVQAAIKN